MKTCGWFLPGLGSQSAEVKQVTSSEGASLCHALGSISKDRKVNRLGASTEPCFILLGARNYSKMENYGLL